ncbi:MAG: hypothetical protein QOF57_1819 [Frankiaceae bacterium]|nr:hypothetical protein [Frankiaceae bacterium]MDQ1727168.1 hypothetical protein [Frankiaceae bacterium]
MEEIKQISQYLEARIRSMRGDRGDVPGWVMITLMTAALVAIVWTLAAGWLTKLFNQAESTVTGPGATPGTTATG